MKKCNIYGQLIRAYTTNVYERLRPSYTSEYGRRMRARKSRRDDTLLTVDFNLRTRNALCSRQSPAGTAQHRLSKVSSLRDFGIVVYRLLRRLKPPVNRVSSLRDFLWGSRFEVSHCVRDDSEEKGKEKAFIGGFAADKRPPLSHVARHVDRRETSVKTITG